MKKVFLLPNVITAFGLACGLFVIFKVNMIEPGCGYDVVMTSTFLLLLAAFADFIDGAIARVFHAESQFGFMFDSLADTVSFAVAPSVLMLKSLSLQQGTWLSMLAATGAMVYSLCGVLRLVRFNVQKKEVSGDLFEMAKKKKHFTGLPITAGAAGAVSVNLFLISPLFQQWAHIDIIIRSGILSGAMILLGYLMVSRWKFPSLKGLNFSIATFPIIFVLVLFAVCIFYGILYYFSIAFCIVSWGYILVAIILGVIRKFLGKKSKTLSDFEPDDDEK